MEPMENRTKGTGFLKPDLIDLLKPKADRTAEVPTKPVTAVL